jgi:hypothetical protein
MTNLAEDDEQTPGSWREPDLPELIAAWVCGWAVSRESPPPTPIPGGFVVDVHLPVTYVRYVLHTWDVDTLRRLGDEVTVPGTGIKIRGTNADLRPALPGMWAVGTYDRGYLMTTTFRAGAAMHVAPYAARIVMEGQTHVAHVMDADAGRPDHHGDLGCDEGRRVRVRMGPPTGVQPG